MIKMEIRDFIKFLYNKNDKNDVFEKFSQIESINNDIYNQTMDLLLADYYRFYMTNSLDNCLIKDFKLPKDILYNIILEDMNTFNSVLSNSYLVSNYSIDELQKFEEIKLLNWNYDYEIKRNTTSMKFINYADIVRDYILNFYIKNKFNIESELLNLKNKNQNFFDNIMMLAYSDFKKIENIYNEEEKSGLSSIENSDIFLNLVNGSMNIANRVLSLELKYLFYVVNDYDEFLEPPIWLRDECIFNIIEVKLKNKRKY